MRDRDVKPGDPVSKFTAEAYRAIVAELASWEVVKGAWPIIVDDGTSGKRVRIDHTQGFYATLSGSTSPYSFVERFGTTGGTWTAGQRTGTTNAYEVNSVASLNGKVVWVEPGFPGDYRFQYIGSGSACATATINATAVCGGSGSALSGFTFDLRDSGDTTTLATQSGSSASFTGQDGTLSYKVRVSKAGYHTKTSSTVTPGCGGTIAVAVSTWPTTYSQSFHLYLNDAGLGTCPHEGVTVAVTGDATASGSTDSSGNVTLSLSSTSTSATQSLNYTFTPTSGRGVASKSGSFTVNACSPTTYNDSLSPSTGHVAVVCNNKYMPDELTATDDYGSCTATYDSGSGAEAPTWEGSYTYESTNCINDYECSPPFVLPTPDMTSDVTVVLKLFRITADSDCVDSVWDVGRGLCYGTAGACFAISGTTAVKCQPVADAIAGGSSFPDCTLPPYVNFEGLDQTYSCPSSISIDFTIGTKTLTAISCEETGVDVNFSGTIT